MSFAPNGVQFTDFYGQQIVRDVQHVSWDPILVKKATSELSWRLSNKYAQYAKSVSIAAAL
jgi:hypothetical protein